MGVARQFRTTLSTDSALSSILGCSNGVISWQCIHIREVECSYKQAGFWFEKAAAKQVAQPQYNLGLIYGNGQGVARDYLEADKWFILAGVNGYEGASKGRVFVE